MKTLALRFSDLSSGVRPSVENLLKEAVLWLDPSFSVPGEQIAVNKGKGGSALNAQYGSTTGVDTNDPLFLPHTGENYVELPGSILNNLSVPDSPELRITGDIDLRVCLQPYSWQGSINVVLSKNNEPSTQGGWALDCTNGSLRLYLSTDGTNLVQASSSAAHGIPDGQRAWVRATWRASDGRVQFFKSGDGVVWTQIGTDRSIAIPSIFSSNHPIGIGTNRAGAGSVNPGPAGKYYAAQVRNGIDGPIVFDFNSADVVSGDQTSFVCSSGQIATVNRHTLGRKPALVTRPMWLLASDDHLEIADNSLLDFNATDSFTVMAIVRHWLLDDWSPLVSKRISNASADKAAGWGLLQYGGPHGAYVQIADGVDLASANINHVKIGALSGYFGVTDRGAQKVSGYLNGNKTGEMGLSAPIVDSLENSDQIRIGAMGGAVPTSWFNGEIYGVAVWRRALTAEEIESVSEYYKTIPVSEAEQLLSTATLWLDAKNSVAGEQTAINQGSGGSALNAQYGSTTGADTNDPLVLEHSGENYIHFPGLSGEKLTVDAVPTAQVNEQLQIIFCIDDFVGVGTYGTPFAVGRSAADRAGVGLYLKSDKSSYVFANDGNPSLRFSVNSMVVPPADTRWWRITVVNSFEGGNAKLFVDVSSDTTSDVQSVSWSSSFSNTAAVPYAPYVLDSTSPMSFGGLNYTGVNPLSANFKYAEVNIDGANVFKLDISHDIVSGGQTSFVASSGQTVTMVRASSGRKMALVTRPIWLFGTDDYLEIADNALLDFNASESMTALVVYRHWAYSSDAIRILLSKRASVSGGASTPGYLFRLGTSNNMVILSDNTPIERLITSAFGNFPIGDTNLMLSIQTPGLASYYNKNSLLGTDSDPLSMGDMTSSTSFRVGASAGGGSGADVEILAVAVFRKALTPAEIDLINQHYGTV